MGLLRGSVFGGGGVRWALLLIASCAWGQIDYNNQVKNKPGLLSDQSNYLTFYAACTDAIAKGQTLAVTKAWSVTTSGGCAANLMPLGGVVRPTTGHVITFTGYVSPTAIQWVDYSMGGTVNLTAASFSYGLPEWFGAKADGATASAAPINNLLTAMGAGHLVMLGFGSGCYLTGTTTLTIGQGQGITGPAPFSKACLQYTGSGDVIANSSNTTFYTFQNFGIQTTTAATAIHLNGAVGKNSTNVDISGVDFSPNSSSVYSTAEVLLEDSYLVHVHNNKMGASAPYALKMGSTFNNTETVDGNEISGTAQAGVYCENSCTGIKVIGNVIEGNQRKAIQMASGNPSYGNLIAWNHLEDNGLGTADYEISVVSSSGTSFNGVWGPTQVIGNDINNTTHTQLGAVYIAYQQNASITGNRCIGSTNSGSFPIVLGPAVVWAQMKPDVQGNPGCTLQGDSGSQISDASSILTYSNLFKTSVDLINTLVANFWSISGPGSPTVDQAGAPLFADGTPAWNLNLGTGISTNPAGLSGFVSTTVTGRLFSCGVWAKANTGTVVGYVELGDAYGTYTGSLGTTQTIVGSNQWKWISASATTSTSDAGSFMSCFFKFYSVSGPATIVRLSKPQMCADTMVCGYVPTTTLTVDKASSPTGHTVFAQLPAGSKSQPPIVCDDCTIANPTLGGGTGALVVPIGAVNIGK